MELISYNGIELQIVKTNVVERVPVRSEDRAGDYLFTKWTIDVIAQINPGATSYIMSNGVPEEDPDNSPGTTDNAIRQFLAQDRKVLTIIAGGETILDSPDFIPGSNQTRQATDARNGPFCEVFAITQIVGTQNFAVHIRFVTYVNECEETNSIVLSNRWNVSESIDDLFYPTRNTSGKVILRTDLMYQQQLNADSFRSNMFFPVPDNFQRENIEVKLSEDGAELTYSFRDVGKCFNRGFTSPIVKAKIFQTGNYVAGNHMRGIAQGLLETTNGIASAAGGIDGLSILRGIGTALASHSATHRKYQILQLPHYEFSMEVQLWGDRNTPRSKLHRIAMGIAAGQLNPSYSGLGVGLSEISMTHDRCEDNYVLVRYTIKWGDDLNQAVNPLGGVATGNLGRQTFFSMFDGGANSAEIDDKVDANYNGMIFNDILPNMPANPPRIPGVFNQPVTTYFAKDSSLTPNPPFRANPAPPGYTQETNAFGSRSTLIVSLVHQALNQPCKPPATVPLKSSAANSVTIGRRQGN